MSPARAADNTLPTASSEGSVLAPFALAAALLSSCAGPGQENSAKPAPAFLVVGAAAGSRTTGLALVDAKFRRLASTDLGERIEYAVSPDRDEIAAAWVDAEDHGFLQIFGAKDLSPLCARTAIAHYATDTTGFWHPILWMGESELVVEFVTTPRPSPDRGFDAFYAQVFQLPSRPDRPLALDPDRPRQIELPADNTYLLAVVDEDVIVLSETVSVRGVNLRTGAAGAAIEVRPRLQDGILEAPMGWCREDDSKLLVFGFDGSVREIQTRPELKILRRFALPDLPDGAHVGKGEVARDPFRPDRVCIGLEYLDKSGPVQVRAVDGGNLLDSLDRGPGHSFAPAKDGRVLTWSDRIPSAIRLQGPSGRSDFGFDGSIGAVVSIE